MRFPQYGDAPQISVQQIASCTYRPVNPGGVEGGGGGRWRSALQARRAEAVVSRERSARRDSRIRHQMDRRRHWRCCSRHLKSDVRRVVVRQNVKNGNDGHLEDRFPPLAIAIAVLLIVVVATVTVVVVDRRSSSTAHAPEMRCFSDALVSGAALLHGIPRTCYQFLQIVTACTKRLRVEARMGQQRKGHSGDIQASERAQ